MGISGRYLEATEKHLGGWGQLRDTLQAPCRHFGVILETSWRQLGGWSQLRNTLEASWRHLQEPPKRKKTVFSNMFWVDSGATEDAAAEGTEVRFLFVFMGNFISQPSPRGYAVHRELFDQVRKPSHLDTYLPSIVLQSVVRKCRTIHSTTCASSPHSISFSPRSSLGLVGFTTSHQKHTSTL